MSDTKRRVRYVQPSLSVTPLQQGVPRALVAHDQSVVGEVLRLLLVDEIEVVAETRSGRAAMALAELFEPEVLIMGETFIDGVVESFLPGLLAAGVRVVVVCHVASEERCSRLVSLGALGIVDDESSPHDLVSAVRLVADGGASLPPRFVATMVEQWRSRDAASTRERDGDLTTREDEVLAAMARGLSTKALARQLGISPKTVESHKTRIYEKLGVKTQAAAVAKVLAGAPAGERGSGGSL